MSSDRPRQPLTPAEAALGVAAIVGATVAVATDALTGGEYALLMTNMMLYVVGLANGSKRQRRATEDA